MTDQCINCALKDDLNACQTADCFQHESWYARKMQSQIEQLEKDKNNLSGLIENLQYLVGALKEGDGLHYKMNLEFALKFAKEYQAVVTK